MTEFITVFLALLVEAVPFLLAGVAVSVLAGPVVERLLEAAPFRQPAAGVVAGTGAGFLLPMCDCGSRPLSHRLALAGHRDFAVAFLVAAPVMNPIVIVTTWLAFRQADLVVMRLGLTALIAFAIGLVVAQVRGEIALPMAGGDDGHHDGGGSPSALAGATLHEFVELFPYLAAGAAVAAGVQVFVDQSWLTSVEGVFISVLAMMVLAFVLSICSSVDAFVAAPLGGALGTGPVLAFMAFGPIVNLKSIPLYLKLFTPALVLVVAVVATQVAFVGALAAQLRGW